MIKKQLTYFSFILFSMTIIFAAPSDKDTTELQQLIQEHADLLNRYPKSEFAATLLFQLAELQYDYAQQLYDTAMQQYEQDLTAFDNGTLAQEPQTPQPNMQPTIQSCERFLSDYPASHFRDRVLYKKAIAESEGKYADASRQSFMQLVEDYPESQYVSEARFRIGEYHFNMREYRRALDFYQEIVKDETDAYFNMALYKEGWCYYSVEDYDQAIAGFMRLIERFEATPDSSGLNLRSEAITYIAGSFTESGGTNMAKSFFLDKKEKSYTPSILEKMTQLYSDRNDYRAAIAAFRVLLDFYPFSPKAPDYFSSIVENFEIDRQTDQANAVRREIVDFFGPGGPWQHQDTALEQRQIGLTFARDHLEYLASFYQSRAVAEKDALMFEKAISHYNEFILKYTKAENIDRMRFNLADCYFQFGQFRQSAETYADIVKLHTHSTLREESGYNRFLAYLELKNEIDPVQADTLMLTPFFQPDSIRIVYKHRAKQEILTAGHDFIYTFSNSTLLSNVLMAFAEILNELHYSEYAAITFEQVVKREKEFHIQAALNAAQCYFDAQAYPKAVKWTAYVENNMRSNAAERQKANTLKALAQFKLAENLQDSKELGKAGEQYLQTARSTLEPSLRERAFFDAAATLQKSGDTVRAAAVFSEMAHELPSSQAVDRALYNAAGLYENLENWQQAATHYVAVWQQRPDSDLAAKALLNAARCYEFAQHWHQALDIYKNFDEQFSQLYADRIESSVRAAEICQTLQDNAAAKTWLRNADTIFSRAANIDPYFAARAKFMLLQYIYNEFAEIELVPPLKVNLERKIALFKQIATASSAIIRLETADWTLAATHYLGMTFEELAASFLRAPIPDELNAEQRQTYEQQLQERAAPYSERAIETFQKNVQQAQENGLANEWSRKSNERLQEISNNIF